MASLAHYVLRLRDLGVTDQGFATVRRLRIINLVSVLAAATTLIYCLFYAIYDRSVFWREILFLPAMSLGYLSALLFTRCARPEAATWTLVSVALFHLAVISWLLGANSGVLSYLLIVPFVLALLTDEQDRVSVWPAAVATGVIFVFVSFGKQAGSLAKLSETVQTWVFLVNTFGAILLSCTTAVFFRWLILKAERELDAERRRSDRLLLAILPESIVGRLKSQPDETIAQDIPDATVVFADIVGFTGWSMHSESADVVSELNRIFSRLDALCAARGLEKIKTIGDAYMAVSGAPEPRADHRERVADFALDLLAEAKAWRPLALPRLRFRIVLASGPLVAGVIGQTKFAYDVWGNAVNTASRMEAHCQPGEILMAASTAAGLPDRFERETLGQMMLRDQGATEVFRLTGRDPPRHARDTAAAAGQRSD